MLYNLEKSWLPLILPSLCVLGLLLQLVAIYIKKTAFLIAGLILAVSAALCEMDLTLAAGDTICCACAWQLVFRSRH